MHLSSFSLDFYYRKTSIIFSYPQIDEKFTCQRIHRNATLTNDPSKSPIKRTSHWTTTKQNILQKISRVYFHYYR